MLRNIRASQWPKPYNSMKINMKIRLGISEPICIQAVVNKWFPFLPNSVFPKIRIYFDIGKIYYSKLHFDLSELGQGSGAEYCTVQEAMEKFKLSRDSVCGILQFHRIPREKNERYGFVCLQM